MITLLIQTVILISLVLTLWKTSLFLAGIYAGWLILRHKFGFGRSYYYINCGWSQTTVFKEWYEV